MGTDPDWIPAGDPEGGSELRRAVEAAWSGHEWRPWAVRRAMAVEQLEDEINAELGCGYRGCLYCARLGFTGGGGRGQAF